MRKIITILLVFSAGIANAQVYKGKGDTKFQVGANFQDGATGINVTTDFGIGKNMSYGFSATYLLSADKILDVKPKFEDRIDAKARFNAHLADVLGIEDKFDLYPGLDLGLRNFGAHIGARYFFTDGIGVYTEAGFPIAKYDTHVTGFEYYNNQFTVNAGLSFNL